MSYCVLVSLVGLTYFPARFRRTPGSQCIFVSLLGLTYLAKRLGDVLPTPISLGYFPASLHRTLRAQAGTRSRSHVVLGPKAIHSLLLRFNQPLGWTLSDNTELERAFSIFIPGVLKIDIVMRSLSQQVPMYILPFVQILGATNVLFTIGGVQDFVNATSDQRGSHPSSSASAC